ncbi:MAG: hypothetical protein RL149_459 [Actinomycetota bacterium]
MFAKYDREFTAAIPGLMLLQARMLRASELHQTRQQARHRLYLVPNFAELAIVCQRLPHSLSPSFGSCTVRNETALPMIDLLNLRADFYEALRVTAVVPQSKQSALACYLATTASPTSDSLASFCQIQVQRSRYWLKALEREQIIRMSLVTGELFAINQKLISALTGIGEQEIASQFDALVSTNGWLKHSQYRRIL